TEFRDVGVESAVGGTAERPLVLDWTGSAHLPRGQSAYQGASILGVGDWRRQGKVPGSSVPGGSLYTSTPNVPSGQARILAIVLIFHLAQYQGRADRLFP